MFQNKNSNLKKKKENNMNIKYLCKKPSSKKCTSQWTARREPSLRCHLKLNSWVTQAGKTVKTVAKHPHAEWPCKRYSTHTMLSVCAKNILQSVHFRRTKAFPLMQIFTISHASSICKFYYHEHMTNAEWY